MPSSGEDHKQQAGDDSHSQRQDAQRLLRLPARPRVEAAHRVPVPESHRREHQHRQHRVHPVHRPHPVLGQFGKGRGGGGDVVVVEEPHAASGGEAVVDPPVGGAPDAVGEAGEEAGGGQEEEERLRHQPGGRVAGAVVGEHRGEELESEEGAGGEEVGQVSCARQRLRYGLLRRGSGWWRWRCLFLMPWSLAFCWWFLVSFRVGSQRHLDPRARKREREREREERERGFPVLRARGFV
ncbi:unnamed protein product [Musa hybrid cultivar]